ADRSTGGSDRFLNRVTGFSSLELAARFGESGGGVGDCLLGIDAGRRLLVDRVFRGGLGALAGVQPLVQRLAVIPLIARLARALERALGRGELLVRVLVGAGGARRVDRALRLLHFPVRRIGARRTGRRGDDRERDERVTQTPHAPSIPPAFARRHAARRRQDVTAKV